MQFAKYNNSENQNEVWIFIISVGSKFTSRYKNSLKDSVP